MSSRANPYLNHKSLAARMRLRRFSVINRLIEAEIARSGRCRILDVGGTEYYWKLNGSFFDKHKGKISVTLVNYGDSGDHALGSDFVERRQGDATKPESYEGLEFDLVHSNSVIEHVGNWASIRSMANCIINTGRPYYLQTPNFWFPMEPHFRFLGWQWLGESARANLLRKRQRGFRGQARTIDEAMASVESVKLLTGSQLRELFPGAEIQREWFGPFVKSFMVVNAAGQR